LTGKLNKREPLALHTPFFPPRAAPRIFAQRGTQRQDGLRQCERISLRRAHRVIGVNPQVAMIGNPRDSPCRKKIRHAARKRMA
jgi:hypothetical protein